MEKIYIGIDLGNTNIKVSIWNNKKKEARPFALGKGHGVVDKVQKNYIYYSKENEKLLGEKAIWMFEPKNSVENIKGKLEKSSWKKYIENLNREKNVMEVIADILSTIKKEIEERHGNTLITNCILTVPVNFSEVQKEIIKKAAFQIGLPIESIVVEPVAAAVGFEVFEDIDEDDDKILIFDFGGGTLDLAIFNSSGDEENREVNILSSYGIKYGGRDIDMFIYNRFIRDKVDFSLLAPDKEKYEVKLLGTTEKLKESLFSEELDKEENLFTKAEFDYRHQQLEILIERDPIIKYFEEIKIKDKIFTVLEQMLEETDLTVEDIKKVKMIGGSSRIRYFQEVLAEYFDDEDVIDIDDLDEEEIYYPVSNGACKYLASLVEDDFNLEINNSAPYEILFYERGKYKTVVDKNAKYEFYSPLKPLILNDEKKVEVYQKIPEIKDMEIEDSKVYIGDITYESSNYSGIVYYRIGTNKKGEITCRLYDSDNIEEQVEEIWL